MHHFGLQKFHAFLSFDLISFYREFVRNVQMHQCTLLLHFKYLKQILTAIKSPYIFFFNCVQIFVIFDLGVCVAPMGRTWKLNIEWTISTLKSLMKKCILCMEFQSEFAFNLKSYKTNSQSVMEHVCKLTKKVYKFVVIAHRKRYAKKVTMCIIFLNWFKRTPIEWYVHINIVTCKRWVEIYTSQHEQGKQCFE